MLVAALPVRVAFLPGVEAGGSVPTDGDVVGADLLSLLGSAGLPETADAELGLNKLRLDHEDQVLAADVRPLDEDVAVNTTASGLVVEDVARRRVLELDRLHVCEAGHEGAQHLGGKVEPGTERRKQVERHRLAREHVLEGARGHSLAGALARASRLERLGQHEVSTGVGRLLSQEVPVAPMRETDRGAVLALSRLGACPVRLALRVDRSEHVCHSPPRYRRTPVAARVCSV